MITIFTPTYNRIDYLGRLYNSLEEQTNKSFQWVIVDDGSTDGTENYINNLKDKSSFEIVYKKVENGGKMRAINQGVALAAGEYFFIVDSDDYLTIDAVEKINNEIESLPKDFAGLVFRKNNITGENFPPFPQEVIDSNPVEIFYNKKILGDKAEVFKRDVLKEFPFPEIEGEKFVPEGLIWNRIGKKYKLRYINKIIYNFEYIQDGYTRNFSNIIKKNPRGFALYYKEMLGYNIPLINKIKFFIRYIQSLMYIKKNKK